MLEASTVDIYTYVIKSTRGEAACGPARGWGIAAVLHAGVIELEATREPRLIAKLLADSRLGAWPEMHVQVQYKERL